MNKFLKKSVLSKAEFERSLAEAVTLFVVGDCDQAIKKFEEIKKVHYYKKKPLNEDIGQNGVLKLKKRLFRQNQVLIAAMVEDIDHFDWR